MPGPFKGTLEEYIFSRIRVDPLTQCWNWGDGQSNYGSFNFQGYIGRCAHVEVYEFYNGPVPPGKIVRHTCDNTKCVNPGHLITGTKKDNRRDFMERHPQAKEIMLKAQNIAQQGAREFWAGMSPVQRKEFSEKRSAAQSAKGSRKLSPETKAKIKASWIKRKERSPNGHKFRPRNLGC